MDNLPVPTTSTPPAGAIVVKGKLYSPVYMGKRTGIVKLSQREQKFLHRYLQTLNLFEACHEVGIRPEVGRGYLRRSNVRAYIDHMLEQQAFAAGVSLESVKARFMQAFEGSIELSKKQMEAGKVLARIVKPAAPSGGTQVQVNVNVGESRYKDAPVEVLTEQMAERLKAVRGDA